MNIIKGKIKKAQKVVIYGVEGIGKSSLAAKFPNPIFSDVEGGTNKLDVARFERATSWALLRSQAEYIKNNPTLFKTSVIYTIDWAERLCIESICAVHGKKGIEDFGYGTGYVYIYEELGKFLNFLEDIVDVGVNVVLLAHAQIRKFEQPDEMGAYDRYELKLGKKTSSQTSPIVKEWADMILFANFKTFAVQADKDGKKFKGKGGQRTLFTNRTPCWDAKNRDDLASELPLDYSSIAHVFEDVAFPTQPKTEIAPPKNVAPEPAPKVEEKAFDPSEYEDPIEDEGVAPEYIIPPEIPKPLADLMEANKVTVKDIQIAVASKGYFPETTPIENYGTDFINGCLIAAWAQVYEIIKQNNKEPF